MASGAGGDVCCGFGAFVECKRLGGGGVLAGLGVECDYVGECGVCLSRRYVEGVVVDGGWEEGEGEGEGEGGVRWGRREGMEGWREGEGIGLQKEGVRGRGVENLKGSPWHN